MIAKTDYFGEFVGDVKKERMFVQKYLDDVGSY